MISTTYLLILIPSPMDMLPAAKISQPQTAPHGLCAAKTNMLGSCQMRIGGRAVLHDCAVRYEEYPFDD